MLGHLREDEVGRPVHDPEDPIDALPCEGLAQGPDQRDPAGHGGFEVQIASRPVRGGEELLAVGREELLVGGHDRLAARQRAQEELARRLDTPHELADDVDPGVVDDGARDRR